jgi:ribokinase
MGPNQPRVCVVGSANVDLTFRTANLPRPGETLPGRAFKLDFGGKGANQAVSAARLGAAVTLIARVGCDLFGDQALERLRQEGIDSAHVSKDGERPTGVASIAVDDAGRNCIVVVGGANLALSPDDVRAAADALRAAHVLVAQFEVALPTVLEALTIARAAGVRTLLNPAPAATVPEEMMPLIDICVLNETEAEQLTGRPVTTPEEAKAAAATLHRRGAGAVLVTLGGNGVLVLDDAGAEHLSALEVPVVDTTGAGDAFIGGLAVFLAEGLSLRAAAELANAVAALSVTRLGAQAALPARAELNAFLAGRPQSK